jgi:hypothetical protein
MPKSKAKDQTGSTERDLVHKWQERISISKRDMEDWSKKSGANRFCEEYEGNYNISFNSQRYGKIRIPPINEVFSYVQSDIASTYSRDPYITVNAKAGTVKGAALWELWLNYQWRELKIKEEMELEILDKDLVGYGFHKVGHAVQSVGTDEQMKIVNESLYSRRLSWRDVFWNLGSRRPPVDCMWMAQRIVKPLEEIKRRYPAAQNLPGTAYPEIDKDQYKSLMYKDDIKFGVLYEIWDAESKQIIMTADGLQDKFLEPARPWPDYLDEFPFLMYWDYAIPGKSRPMSAIAPWEDQILEKMILMAQAVNHAKRWNRQLLVMQGAIDGNSLDKFERGDDGAVIEVTGTGDLNAKARFMDFGPLPTDFYLLMDRISAIENETNGQPGFDRGGVQKTNTRTIGELTLIKEGAKGRTNRKIDRLETHLENVARHMMAHMKANFDGEKVIKITGWAPQDLVAALGDRFDPKTGNVKFTAEDIEGEYDADVKAGSTLPLDKQTRLQILETVLQTIAQVASKGPMSPFLNAVIQETLKDYDMKSLQEAYQLEVQQAQKMMQEEAGKQNVNEVKTMAEAAKRQAQAKQVNTETEIMTAQEIDRQSGLDQILEVAKNGNAGPGGHG